MCGVCGVKCGIRDEGLVCWLLAIGNAQKECDMIADHRFCI